MYMLYIYNIYIYICMYMLYIYNIYIYIYICEMISEISVFLNKSC